MSHQPDRDVFEPRVLAQLALAQVNSNECRTLCDDDVAYIPAFLSTAMADHYFKRLLKYVPWTQHSVTLFSRSHDCPRLSAWFGDPECDYAYSGHRHRPLPWIDELNELRKLVEARFAVQLNSALANLYRNGSDSMGWHSDDEPELGKQPTIVSLTLGSQRRFRLRHKHTAKREHVTLEHGSILLMTGATQEIWQHALPKTRKPVGPRINVTFRHIES